MRDDWPISCPVMVRWCEDRPDQVLEVDGLSSDHIGTVAAGAGITLFELTTQGASLEEAYMALTADSLDYRSSHAPEHEERVA